MRGPLTIIDQLGRQISLQNPAKRIVSVVPSQTELLSDLIPDSSVVGITKFCVHPEQWFRTKTRVGGTKNLDIPLIRSLNPDLIIAGKEENLESEIKALSLEFPVYVSDVCDLPAAKDMIIDIGMLTDTEPAAERLTDDITQAFAELAHQPIQQGNCAYIIWKDPYMTVGGDTFIHEMMKYCGFQNAFADQKRYPVTSLEEIKALQCKYVLLSSEPYPFSEKHIEAIQTAIPDTRVMLVDGEMFSWYGSRMLKAPEYFKQLVKQPNLLYQKV